MKTFHIVAGLDGSVHGEVAAAWARALATRIGAEVITVHARGMREHGAVDVPEGVTIEDGDPVSVLLRVAEEVSADLIVVGRRGSGGNPDLRLGSTSHQLAERAACPLVIIPPEAAVPGLM
ncbi:MAG: universal stress protein [Acidimicrobiales bacterium]